MARAAAVDCRSAAAAALRLGLREDGDDGLGSPASEPMPRTMPMSAQLIASVDHCVAPYYTGLRLELALRLDNRCRECPVRQGARSLS